MDPTRRRYLLLGSSAGLAAVAGCLGGDDDDEDQADDPSNGDETDDDPGQPGPGNDGTLPAGAGLVSTADEMSLLSMYLAEKNQIIDALHVEGEVEPIPDPLLEFPRMGAAIAVFVTVWGITNTGLDDLLRETRADEFDSSVDTLAFPNNVIALMGSFDTNEISSEIEAVDEEAGMGVRFEQIDESGGYTFYESVTEGETGQGDGEDQQVLALNEEHIFIDNSRDGVESVIDSHEGTTDRALDAYEPFEWLLSTVGDAAFVFSGYSPDGLDDLEAEEVDNGPPGEEAEEEAFDEFEAAIGMASSVTFDGDEMHAELAVEFDELTSAIEADIEAALEETTATQAEEYALEFEGNRLAASATYPTDLYQ